MVIFYRLYPLITGSALPIYIYIIYHKISEMFMENMMKRHSIWEELDLKSLAWWGSKLFVPFSIWICVKIGCPKTWCKKKHGFPPISMTINWAIYIYYVYTSYHIISYIIYHISYIIYHISYIIAPLFSDAWPHHHPSHCRPESNSTSCGWFN